jgi:putative ABC transport system substrate-binding protein
MLFPEAGADMRRREFLGVLTGVTAWPWAASAQSRPQRRVGILMNGVASEPTLQSHVASFAKALRQLGWTEGENLRVDVRWNASDAALARTYAAQLIGLQPDVILAASTTNLEIVRQATSTVPVVFVQVSDPVAQGFVASLTKPGANLTGFSQYESSIGGKWLNLLKEAAPELARVVFMFNPETSPQSKFFMRSVEAAASSLGVQANAANVRADADIESALQSIARQPNGGVILPTDSFIRRRQKLIVDLASRHSLPVMSAYTDFVRDGGLMSYSTVFNAAEQFEQAATYVHRILNGTKPGDLPIQGANKYSLAINLKVAKALGLTIPLPLLGLADEVIE